MKQASLAYRKMGTAPRTQQFFDETPIPLDMGTLAGRLANGTRIGISKDHILVDFHFNPPGRGERYLISRVMLTPADARSLLKGLGDIIDAHEQTYGTSAR